MECRGRQIDVFFDGAKIHTQTVPYLETGGIGFYAAGPIEQALFRDVTLHKLTVE